MTSEKRVRHILSLSGGKDSAALAIYLRDRVPEMEYIFSDTRKELPETYEYLQRISNYLGKEVTHLNADVGFDHWYEMYGVRKTRTSANISMIWSRLTASTVQPNDIAASNAAISRSQRRKTATGTPS